MKKLFCFVIPLFVCFSGCKNFMQGESVYKELKKEIEYQNMESNIVRVTTRNQNHGTVFPNGDVGFKKDYPVTLELTLNENYTFEKWRVIDKNTKQDVENLFIFDVTTSSTGRTVITNATMLENVKNIQLIPVCKQIKDTVAPKINDGYKISTSEVQLGTQNSILTKKYTEWTSEELQKVHTKSIWIDFSFFEIDFEEVENYSLEVTETLLQDSQGNASNSQTQFLISDIFENVDNDGTFYTKFEYPFTSGADGIVKLDFSVVDSALNKSVPITCYALKDTSINSKIKLLSYAETQKTYANILKDSNNFYFSVDDLYDKWFDAYTTPVSEIELFIIDSNDKNKKEYPVVHTQNNDIYTFAIPEDFPSSKNNSFKIVIRDKCKNELTCSAPKFSAPENNYIYLYDSTSKNLKIINNNEDEELIIYYSDFNPQENQNQTLNYKIMEDGICILENIDLDNNNLYLFSQKIVNGGKIGTDSHISKISKITKDLTKTYSSESTNLDFTYEYISSGNDGTYFFTVYPENTTDFSSLYLLAGFSDNTLSEEIIYNPIALPCDGDTVMFNLETKYLAQKYDNTSSSTENLNLILILGGIKDNDCYEQKKVINTQTLKIDDNIPPIVYIEGLNNKSETFDRNIISVRKPYDRSHLSRKDGKEYFKLTYFIDGQMEKTLHTITKKINDNNTNEFINIELSNLLNADYSLKPIAVDTNNNESLYGSYKHNISPGYLNKKPTFEINGNDIDVSIDMTGYSNFTNYAFNVEYFDSTYNEWYELLAEGNIIKNEHIVTQTIKNAKDKFIRIRFYAYYYNSTNQIDENKVLIYAEPTYYYASTDNQSTLKNVSKGFGGFSIDCDKPCLVQIYYSKTDLGLTASAWERNCSENKKINKTLFTSHNVFAPDLDSIPDNYFYTIIANFSDGTSVMTEVYSK